MADLPEEIWDTLPSLKPALFDVRALFHSPYPPRSIFVHASSNIGILPSLLRACLPQRDLFDEQPHIQDVLPRAVIVDCAELASQKALFGRVLNGLSGWGAGVWDHALGGVLNWDGRQEGWSIESEEQDPQQYKVNWAYAGAKNANPAGTGKGIMGERKDESISSFISGLQAIYTLGGAHGRTSRRPSPRFVILHNAQKIPGLENLPVGQTEGTLLAALMRLGEFTQCPFVPVLVTSTEWLLLRPQRGATEPAAVIQIPGLAKQDIMPLLRCHFERSIRDATSQLSKQQVSGLFATFQDLLYQTFEPYVGNEVNEMFWLCEKLWPPWIGPVERGEVELNESNRHIALFKAMLSSEIDSLADLRPLGGEHSDAPIDGLSSLSQIVSQRTGPFLATPTKSKRPAEYGASPSFYSPSASPSKRTKTSAIMDSPLAQSLPILSRYILIAAFLASSNPARTDMLMLATEEDELQASKRRKRKGGGARKTPNRRALDVNGNPKKESMPQRLLGPKAFPVERLLAITECILPVQDRKLARGKEVLQEICALTSLRLLIKTSGSAHLAASSTLETGPASSFDKLDGVKLKCNNLELETVEALGKSVDFKVAERLWESF